MIHADNYTQDNSCQFNTLETRRNLIKSGLLQYALLSLALALRFCCISEVANVTEDAFVAKSDCAVQQMQEMEKREHLRLETMPVMFKCL